MTEKARIEVRFPDISVSLEELASALPVIQKLAASPFPPNPNIRYILVRTDYDGRIVSYEVQDYVGISASQIKTYSPKGLEKV